MLLFDTHCHLTDPKFQPDMEELLIRASKAEVDKVIAVADCLEASRKSVELAESSTKNGLGPDLFAAIGVHPHNALDWSPEVALHLQDLCASPKVVAWGEIGLDFHYDFSPRDVQIRAFLEQAECARTLKLPMILHCREAYDLFIDLAQSHDLGAIGGVVHCFSGTVEQAKKIVEMGFYLGITGVLTFKSNHLLREVVRAAPQERLVLETDGPYLAPIPMRGKRNEPAMLTHVAERLAEELGATDDAAKAKLWERLYRNSLDLFRL